MQLGFNAAWNYPFLVDNSTAANQFFYYMPQVLQSAYNLSPADINISSIAPYNTLDSLQYITALGQFQVPESTADKIAADVTKPMSALYQQDDAPDGPKQYMMSLVNMGIPVIPGTPVTGTSSDSSSTNTASSSGLDSTTEQQTTTPAAQKSTAGIVTGAVGLGAAYAVAMFFVARRYKQRKMGHRRSSSMVNPAEMRQSGSPALMGGAGALMSGGRATPGTNYDRQSRGSGRSAGNSARTQEISAPIMAENSLGWN